MTILHPAAPPSAPAASSRAATTTADPGDAAAFASHLESARGELAAQNPGKDTAAVAERAEERTEGPAEEPTVGAPAALARDADVPAPLQAVLSAILGLPDGAGLVPEAGLPVATPSGDAAADIAPSTGPLAVATVVPMTSGASRGPLQPGPVAAAGASAASAEAPSVTPQQAAAASTPPTPAAHAATGQGAVPAAPTLAVDEASASAEQSPAAEQPPSPATAQREGAGAAVPVVPATTGPTVATPRFTDAAPAVVFHPATETRPDSSADAAPAADAPDPLVSIPPSQLRSAETTVPTAVAAPARTMGEQLVRPLLALRTAPAGEHVFTVQVTPEALGPVTVRAHVSADGVRIELVAANDQAREALKTLLPDLRRDLSQGGLSASLDLSAGKGEQGQREAGRGELGQREQGGGAGEARERSPGQRATLAAESQQHRYQGSGASTSIDVLA